MQGKLLFALFMALSAPAFTQDDLLRRAAELDNAHLCAEAERYYLEALAKGSPSAPLLNNTGNHYLACGRPDQAETYFERLLKINPFHGNANLQMARVATDRKQGARALGYLSGSKTGVRPSGCYERKPTGMQASAMRHWASWMKSSTGRRTMRAC